MAIGLYLNEALSNCLKYAFPNDQKGTVGVYFHVRGDDWSLTIDDDGVGHHQTPVEASGGLGTNLMSAFARQAGATHVSGPIESGYRASITRSRESAAEPV